MKVSEAKEKVCPFTVYTEKYKDPIKTYDISYETKGSNCIAGSCLAWQYQDKDNWFKDCDKPTEHGYCKRLNNE